MRRLWSLALVAMLAVVACAPADEASHKLAAAATKSSLLRRSFVYRTIGKTDAYTMTGEILDDFRYGMTMSYGDRPLVRYVVSDDSLAVQLADPGFAARLANSFGSPTVDEALRAGKWVVDPSGAPPLFRKDTGKDAGKVESDTTGDPFRDVREAINSVRTFASQATKINEWSLEDIEYHPQYDPWRYPAIKKGEIRLDLIRPPLPKNASQTLGRRGDDASTANFRKTSVFVEKGRVEEVCSVVDVAGHEDFLALKQRGDKSNPFLARLRDQIDHNQLSAPIIPRDTVFNISYPKTVSVALPKEAVIGKLTTFVTAFDQAYTSGALRPTTATPKITNCLRRGTNPA